MHNIEIDTNSMTLEQCQESVAKANGWRVNEVNWWTNDGGRQNYFPYNNSIDDAARSMPKGWNVYVEIRDGAVFCSAVRLSNVSRDEDMVLRCNGDTEMLARYRLAAACWLATTLCA